MKSLFTIGLSLICSTGIFANTTNDAVPVATITPEPITTNVAPAKVTPPVSTVSAVGEVNITLTEDNTVVLRTDFNQQSVAKLIADIRKLDSKLA
jgi:hypothetical protein